MCLSFNLCINFFDIFPNQTLAQGSEHWRLRTTAITMDTFTLRSEEQLAASTRISQSTYLRSSYIFSLANSRQIGKKNYERLGKNIGSLAIFLFLNALDRKFNLCSHQCH